MKFLCRKYMQPNSQAFHQFADINAKIGFMLVNAQFFADIAADMIMTLQLNIFSNILSAQAYRVQIEVIDFVNGKLTIF